ncbi:hypothetical protein FM120_10965 [Sphingobacterium faecium PCAi_F2.5]|nr:hypothetical protein FM120_10965 [Sphingobacterium faecium PCAi_F2.5]
MTDCKPEIANHKGFAHLSTMGIIFNHQLTPRLVLRNGFTKKMKK